MSLGGLGMRTLSDCPIGKAFPDTSGVGTRARRAYEHMQTTHTHGDGTILTLLTK